MLGFRFPFQSDLWWLNDRYFDRQNRGWRIDQTIGRLKPGVSREQAQAGMQRIRGLLVVAEIALAVVLLAGAGLMLRSFLRLQNTSPGFNAENVLHLEINPTYQRREDYRVEFMSRRYQQLLQKVAEVPGVIAVAANNDLPFVGQKLWYRGEFTIAGQPGDEQKQNPLVN